MFEGLLSVCSRFKEFKIYFVYFILLPSSVYLSFSCKASLSIMYCSSPFLLLNFISFESVLNRIWLWSKKSTWKSLLLNLNIIACLVFSHCLMKILLSSLSVGLISPFIYSLRWDWNFCSNIFFLLKSWSVGSLFWLY